MEKIESSKSYHAMSNSQMTLFALFFFFGMIIYDSLIAAQATDLTKNPSTLISIFVLSLLPAFLYATGLSALKQLNGFSQITTTEINASLVLSLLAVIGGITLLIGFGTIYLVPHSFFSSFVTFIFSIIAGHFIFLFRNAQRTSK